MQVNPFRIYFVMAHKYSKIIFKIILHLRWLYEKTR